MGRFQRFNNASRAKRWASAVAGGRPGNLPKWTDRPAWTKTGAMQWLKNVDKIAVDEEIDKIDLPPTRCTTFKGSRRLMSIKENGNSF